MSLINQMLRDLETRHSKGSGPDVARQNDPGGDNPHPVAAGGPSGKRRVFLTVTAIVLLGCGAGAGWYLAQPRNPQQTTPHPTLQARVAPAERIPVPEQPEPVTHDTVEVAQIPKPQPPSDKTQSAKKSPAATESVPAQTASAQKVAALEKEAAPTAPAKHTDAIQAEKVQQPAAREEVEATRIQVDSTRKVNISHASEPLEQRRRVLNQAQQHYASADYPATIALLQQHLEQPRAQLESGAAASDLSALDARIYRQLALAQLRLNQTDAAINSLEQGHLHAPEDVELHMLYARVLLEQKASERAYTMLRHMPQPQITAHADFYALRAALARRQGAYTEAVELYTLLCQLHPQRGDWRLGLAISQHQQGDLNQAYQNYQRAAANTRMDQKLRAFATHQAEQLQR